MTIQFPADVEAAIQHVVESGRFRDTDEALRAAVNLLKENNRQLEWLRAAIAETDAQVERGEFYFMTLELMDEIEAEVEDRFLRGEMLSPVVYP
jgi:putative addiction module CopG family antidote